jgi:hypothetical protein
VAKVKSEKTSDIGGPDGRPGQAPVLSVRFLLALLLVAAGVAWVAVYYVAVGSDGTGGPAFMDDLDRWNYLIGFGALMLGLAISAHPKTPLGRGRGVVVGMLFCFLVGLFWIVIFYVFTNTETTVPLITDLNQYNLIVGIAFMAVGFVFATRWE